MMESIFIRFLNTSITATWVVLAVLILRLVFKKMPKWTICLLWGIVGLRLLLPFSFQSVLSLLPSAQTIPSDIAFAQNPAIDSGIPAVSNAINAVVTDTFRPELGASVNPLQVVLYIGSIVWLAGAAAMAIYGVISWFVLRRQVRISLSNGNGVYLCDTISSPFILGIIKPKIYIPSGLNEAEMQYVLRHEQAHLQRGDHWWKPLGFALLAVYWFNPFLWVAYILLCRDIEHACDEKVVKDMDNADKCGYAETLVSCSVQRRMVMACPLAFGEVAVKDRIKAVLHYKKPMFWVVVAASVGCIVMAVCFLTDPIPCEHTYESQITMASTCTQTGVMTYTCSQCRHSYTEPIDMLEHAYDGGKVINEATCTQTGTHVLTCKDCGYVKIGEIPVAAHAFGEVFVTKEPNCTEKGEKSATCAVCQQTLPVEILETNDVHDMNNTVIRAATCSDPGEGTNTCQLCGHTEQCTYELLAHDYYEALNIPATCARNGLKEMRCRNCEHSYPITTPKTDEHRWVSNPFGQDFCSRCMRFRSAESPGYSSNIITSTPAIMPEDLLWEISWYRHRN